MKGQVLHRERAYLKISRQVIGLKRTSDQKVAYVSFKASVTETKSQGQHMERRHLKWVAKNKS